jgi:hypothetical protein
VKTGLWRKKHVGERWGEVVSTYLEVHFEAAHLRAESRHLDVASRMERLLQSMQPVLDSGGELLRLEMNLRQSSASSSRDQWGR